MAELPAKSLKGQQYQRPRGRPKGYKPKTRSKSNGVRYGLRTRFSFLPETLAIIYRCSRNSGKSPGSWMDFVIQDLESKGKLLDELKEKNLTIKEVRTLIEAFELLNNPIAVDTLLTRLRTALDVAEAIDVDAEPDGDPG
jgi:hypothetical protein